MPAPAPYFSDYLRQQAHREDPVGNLARMFVADVGDDPDARRYRTASGFRAALDTRPHTTTAHYRALGQAANEHARHLPRP